MFLRGKTKHIIVRAKSIRFVGTASSCALVLFLLLAIFPITKISNDVEAAVVPATTTLAIVSSRDTASVEITPNSVNGTFAKSTSENEIAFTVATNNLTGYSLTIVGNNNDGELINVGSTANRLSSITAATDETTFSSGASGTYTNKWGYRPSKYNSVSNNNYLPAPTTSTQILNQTSTPNATGTSDSYTIGVAARVDYEKPDGTYTSTFILTAVSNPITYQINYRDNSGGTVTGIPSSEGQSNITASSFTLSSTTPVRTGYAFRGWCYGTVNHNNNPSTCTGTVYQPGATFIFTSIPSTGTATADLYAMWEQTLPFMQNLGPTVCTTTPRQVIDNRDGQEYTIQRLADDNCWMMTNLNLGAVDLTTNLTSSNTNLSTTVNASTFNGWRKTSTASTYTAGEFMSVSGTDSTSQTPYGTLYNFYAASAGTISGSTNSNDATYDICPAGWRLPTGGSSGEFANLYAQSAYNTVAKMRAPVSQGGAAFAFAGYFFSSGGPAHQGQDGYYWTSTRQRDAYMYNLYIDSSTVTPADNSTRVNGFPIRCILKENRSITNITYMQQMKKEIASNTSAGTTTTLTDSRDNQTYTVGKMSDGRVWMTRNLAIGCNGSGSTYGSTAVARTLTPDDTNIASSYTTSTTALNAGGSYTASQIRCGTYGTHYNYYATTAGTISGSSNSTNATYDICPKGWRLPTYSEEVTLASNGIGKFNPSVGGWFHTGSSVGAVQNTTTRGYWWSSTKGESPDAATKRHDMVYDKDAGTLTNTDNTTRTHGLFIRCIAKDT